ncbi:MAG TPA: filamentous hemagglutinin N-terminal domain-containing protein, partial [Candidatus Omnitrophota bacterium]|nr:filamentous hemagglutinin N-terminal domain-containing protein [Candidatus Omnitrophota bacterium]
MAIINKILRIFIVFLLVFGVPGQALALPQGEDVIHGGASFVTSGNNMVINQTTDRAIIEYNSFSIGALETVRFQQPNSSSVALNRVIGVDPSSILGSLNANGRIFLINPNGIIFGSDSRIDTAGLIASTLDISNTDFLNEDLIFSGTGGSVINYGKININKPGGYAVLLGAYVKNEGQIVANL